MLGLIDYEGQSIIIHLTDSFEIDDRKLMLVLERTFFMHDRVGGRTLSLAGDGVCNKKRSDFFEKIRIKISIGYNCSTEMPVKVKI